MLKSCLDCSYYHIQPETYIKLIIRNDVLIISRKKKKNKDTAGVFFTLRRSLTAVASTIYIRGLWFFFLLIYLSFASFSYSFSLSSACIRQSESVECRWNAYVCSNIFQYLKYFRIFQLEILLFHPPVHNNMLEYVHTIFWSRLVCIWRSSDSSVRARRPSFTHFLMSISILWNSLFFTNFVRIQWISMCMRMHTLTNYIHRHMIYLFHSSYTHTNTHTMSSHLTCDTRFSVQHK